MRIARELNRSDKTIWLTYQKAKRKMPGTLTVEEGAAIPLSKIADRRCAVLEAVIAHLKEHYGLEYKQIARMLKRSYSTIAGTYRRHKGK